MEDDEPFRPRMRPRAFLRWMRPAPGAPRGIDLVSLLAFVFVLLGFWQLFSILAGQRADDGSAGALRVGGSATTWLVLTAGGAGLLAWSLHRSREPGVRIRWRELLRPRKREP